MHDGEKPWHEAAHDGERECMIVRRSACLTHKSKRSYKNNHATDAFVDRCFPFESCCCALKGACPKHVRTIIPPRLFLFKLMCFLSSPSVSASTSFCSLLPWLLQNTSYITMLWYCLPPPLSFLPCLLLHTQFVVISVSASCRGYQRVNGGRPPGPGADRVSQAHG